MGESPAAPDAASRAAIARDEGGGVDELVAVEPGGRAAEDVAALVGGRVGGRDPGRHQRIAQVGDGVGRDPADLQVRPVGELDRPRPRVVGGGGDGPGGGSREHPAGEAHPRQRAVDFGERHVHARARAAGAFARGPGHRGRHAANRSPT